MVREVGLLNGERTLLYTQPSTSCSLLCPGIRGARHHHRVLHQISFCLRPNGASALDYIVMAAISLAALLAKGGPAPSSVLLLEVTHTGLTITLPKAISVFTSSLQY